MKQNQVKSIKQQELEREIKGTSNAVLLAVVGTVILLPVAVLTILGVVSFKKAKASQRTTNNERII